MRTWTFLCLSPMRWRTLTPIMCTGVSVPVIECLTTDQLIPDLLT